MTRSKNEIEVSDRLIARIQERFGDRGRFALLEKASGIAATKWKNLYYRKQAATEEQLAFWTTNYPEDEVWIFTGKEGDLGNFPFGTSKESAHNRTTVGQRLNWVIEEFASPRGNDLISYLTSRYGKAVLREDWEQLILRKAEPSVDMVTLICEDRPHFAAWVVLGFAPKPSVDPTDEASVSEWKKKRIEAIVALSDMAA